MEPKRKQHPVVDVTDDGSKVRCYKEQYGIGTWNVRSMNQGKLEMVKQEQPPGVKKKGGGNPKYGIYYRKLNILVTLVTKSIGGRLCVIKK